MKKVIINVVTGEETIVDLSPEEIAQIEAAQAAAEEQQAAAEAEAARIADLKASAKTKLVAGEPLTEEEAATLVI